ncbi:MAG: tyrosine-type recombinase/integrase [Candidatus Hodarchaeales archaeon]|jgi:integrase
MNQNLTDQCGAGKNSEILEKYIKFREANNKSKNTIKGDIYTLSKLLNFTNNKPLKEIDESDLQGFMKTLNSLNAITQYGSRIITFNKWLFKITAKHQRPPNMEWFEFPSEELKAKNRDPDVKRFLITPIEYHKIIQYCKTKPKWSALYETLYLSGGRAGEVNSMNIGDVIIEGGKVTIILRNSKTIPRKVPLAETPKMLLRWLQNHPFKNNPDAPLFHSESRSNLYKRALTQNINDNFDIVKKYTGIKSSLTPHCFRKTRATIMFSSRNPVFDDTEIAKFFGWKPHTVSERRAQYDLRDFDDLKAKVQSNVKSVETIETITAERDTLKEELDSLRKQMNDITAVISNMQHNNVAFNEVNCELQDGRLILK